MLKQIDYPHLLKTAFAASKLKPLWIFATNTKICASVWNSLQAKTKQTKKKKAEDKSKYDEIQSAIESELEQEYNNYLESLFENSGNSTKNLWSFIKSKRQDKIGIPALKHQSKLLTTATAKAEALADQYESVFTKEDTEKIPDKGISPFKDMEKITIRHPGVIKLLKSLIPKKAIGSDLVPTTILKQYADIIGPIYNRFFSRA